MRRDTSSLPGPPSGDRLTAPRRRSGLVRVEAPRAAASPRAHGRRDIFQAPGLPLWPDAGLVTGAPSAQEDAASVEAAGAQGVVGKAAPLASLATRLALHALRLGNPRAVAMLWRCFLRELHFTHWEPAVPLPRMGGGGGEGGALQQQALPAPPDHRHCLLQQKLQLLQLSIHARRAQQAQHAQRSRPAGAHAASSPDDDLPEGDSDGSMYASIDERSDSGTWSPLELAPASNGAENSALPPTAALHRALDGA